MESAGDGSGGKQLGRAMVDPDFGAELLAGQGKGLPGPKFRQEGMAGAWSGAGEGGGQDLAVAQLGRAAHARGSGAKVPRAWPL